MVGAQTVAVLCHAGSNMRSLGLACLLTDTQPPCLSVCLSAEDAMQAGIASGLASGMVSGLASGIASSLPSGIETPDVSVQLRKGAESSEPRQLYQVLEQKAAPIGQTTLLGTDHVYVIPGQEKKKPAK